MQWKNSEYNPEIHDRFKALTVAQPYADKIISGEKRIELRVGNTRRRGDLMICSSNKKVPGHQNGVVCGLVELYAVKRKEDLTEEELKYIGVSKDNPYYKKAKYAWMLRNPRKFIEFPVKGQLGIWNLVYTKDVLLEYPKYVTVADGNKKKHKATWRLLWFFIVVSLILMGLLMFGLYRLFH